MDFNSVEFHVHFKFISINCARVNYDGLQSGCLSQVWIKRYESSTIWWRTQTLCWTSFIITVTIIIAEFLSWINDSVSKECHMRNHSVGSDCHHGQVGITTMVEISANVINHCWINVSSLHQSVSSCSGSPAPVYSTCPPPPCLLSPLLRVIRWWHSSNSTMTTNY